MFGRVKDPRNQSYIDYSLRVMLGTMYYKSIAGIPSMQEMTRTFHDERICRNLYTFMGEDVKEYMPHGVTENEFLERLDPGELETVQQNIVYSMIRRKTFDNARVLKKWQVIVDATELDEGYQKKNEYVKYHRSILEAKIYFGENLVCSIASETIENSEKYINQSDEAVKQDCESKAFVRLAAKVKKRFPRLPIILTADGLYVTKKVLQICKDHHWDYIIRYKEGCASSIAKEYRAFPEKETVGTDMEYQNKVMFHDFDVNLIYYRDRRIVKCEEKQTEFAWITSIEITKSNAKKSYVPDVTDGTLCDYQWQCGE